MLLQPPAEVYISRQHAEERLGTESPGPGAYSPSSVLTSRRAPTAPLGMRTSTTCLPHPLPLPACTYSALWRLPLSLLPRPSADVPHVCIPSPAACVHARSLTLPLHLLLMLRACGTRAALHLTKEHSKAERMGLESPGPVYNVTGNLFNLTRARAPAFSFGGSLADQRRLQLQTRRMRWRELREEHVAWLFGVETECRFWGTQNENTYEGQ